MTFLFGDMVLDSERRELRSGSALIPIEPQVFDILNFLIRNRDRVVSKDDLLTAIWGGRLVSDSAIAARINAARRALGDSGEQQHWIRTIARKGFRFVGDVSEDVGSRSLTSGAKAPDQQAPNGISRDQEIIFCRTKDGVDLAIASAGRGMPLVRPCRWFTHVEHEWHNPFRADSVPFPCRSLSPHSLRRSVQRSFRLGRRRRLFEALQHDLDTVVDALGLRSYDF